MSESRTGSTTPRGRALVLTVVAAVALAGAGAFVVGGSPTAADWSPHPGKEVSCPPANETTPNNETENVTENETDDSGYQLVINYTGAWQGTIVTNDTNIPIEGTGDETIDIEADEDERIAATVSKANVTDETMGVTLLLNGLVIDEQKPVEPTVDNFDDNDDDGTANGDDTATDSDFDSTDSAFASTSDTDSLNETGTGEGWTTFGDENEASAFEDDTVVAAEDDPFDDNETVNTSENSLDSDDTDTTNDTTANETVVNETENETDAADECAPVNTTQSTNDTNETNDTALAVETDEEAQIVFADQEVRTNPPGVVVESATLPDSGFVVIHDMGMLQDGDVRGSVVGVSDKLDAQRSEDIEVTLNNELDGSQTLIAVLYRDTDDDGEFEFDATGEMIDEPYTDDEEAAVGDDAYVTVPGGDTADASAFDENNSTASTQDTSVFTDTATPTATVTATDTATATGTPTSPQEAVSGNAEQTTETNAPGFGIGVAIVALLGGALVAARRS